jgi:pyridoxamine 5'-phosphate oxidase
MKDLSDYRKSYGKSALDEKSTPDNPLALFEKWFYEAEAMAATDEVNAMTVSTIGADGYPKSRIVLLKRFDENGFTFFTNYNSEKGKSIAANPNVCLSFFWPGVERQVIIKGIASKTPSDISDDYFNSRPLGSRLGAVASDQSEVIASRGILEDKLDRLEKQFAETDISRPGHWGGYIVKPVEVEFWQGRANRLHDRIRYRLNDNWIKERLAP